MVQSGGITSVLAGVLLFMNSIAFLAFRIDKSRAKNGGWRLPEAALLALALSGGSLGALLAQQVFRHKTRKQPFRSLLVAITVIHLGLAVVCLVPPLGDMALR